MRFLFFDAPVEKKEWIKLFKVESIFYGIIFVISNVSMLIQTVKHPDLYAGQFVHNILADIVIIAVVFMIQWLIMQTPSRKNKR